MIRFICPRCRQSYDVPDREAGTKFSCSACGQRIQVPRPPQDCPAESPFTVQVPAPPEPLDVIRQPARPATGLLKCALAASVVLGLVGGILLVLANSHTTRTPPGAVTGADGRERPKGPAAPSVAEAADGTALARSAYSILKTNCYGCHGESGTAEGGLNFILDRDKLVATQKLLPGDAEHSRLYRRVKRGEMPPEDAPRRPGPGEVAVLKRWIEAGAPAGVPKARPHQVVTDREVAAWIHADLMAVGERDRRFARYFTLTHLANAGLSDDELQTYRHALARLLNSLSWHREIVNPRPVDAGRTVLRIDVRDYRWGERVWGGVLAGYPHGILPDTQDARECYQATGGQLSCVRADWFVATASRPPLYHEVLQLPPTERKLEEQLHIDVREDIRQERVARAGFNGSGVSRNNRVIERHESPYGGYWRSYDFASNVGRRNLFTYPLGPGGDESAFEPDGGEIIFSLPNGLHAFMLINRRGERLDKAPLAIVSDSRRPDRAVENGVSCMACHSRGLIPKDDQVRTHLEQNPAAFSPVETDAIKALYPPGKVLRDLFARDNERFRNAVERTGGRLTTTEPIGALVRQYEKELDLSLAAGELALSPDELSERLNRSAVLARTLGPLRVPGGTVQRQVFNDAFPEIVRELKLGTYVRPDVPPPARNPFRREHVELRNGGR